MASQTATDQRFAHSNVATETHAAHDSTVPVDEPRHDKEPATSAAAEETPLAHAAREIAAVPPSTLMVAGAVAVGAAALFSSGFVRRRAMPALRGVAASAVEIRVPALLPVVLVGIAREIFVEWRTMSAASAASAADAASRPTR